MHFFHSRGRANNEKALCNPRVYGFSRESYMSGQVVLNVLKELRKNKMLGYVKYFIAFLQQV